MSDNLEISFDPNSVTDDMIPSEVKNWQMPAAKPRPKRVSAKSSFYIVVNCNLPRKGISIETHNLISKYYIALGQNLKLNFANGKLLKKFADQESKPLPELDKYQCTLEIGKKHHAQHINILVSFKGPCQIRLEVAKKFCTDFMKPVGAVSTNFMCKAYRDATESIRAYIKKDQDKTEEDLKEDEYQTIYNSSGQDDPEEPLVK